MNKKNPPPPPQAATLAVEPFGTQSSAKFQYFTFLSKTVRRDDLVNNLKLNPNNHYCYRTVVFVTRTCTSV